MPAGGASAGGDFWLRAERDDGAPFLLVGDVQGHGEAAAGCAEVMRRVLRDAARSAERPDVWLEAANAELVGRGRPPSLYTTAVAVLFDSTRRRLTWSYAGHLPPHLLDGGRPLDGTVPGVPLGVREHVGCTSDSIELRAGDGVLLYTDGLEDARGPGGDRFGVARITHTLATAPRRLPPADIVERLRVAVCRFAEDRLSDDICILAARAV